jgi:hypothetical protein
MTKTTNYEISKKLAEIGFKAEAEKCWAKIRHSVSSEFVLVNLDFQVPQHCDEWVLSYDLETLLDVLPKKMTNKYGKEFTLKISFDVSNWIYYVYKNDYIFLSENYIHCQMESEKNESLADTVGRFIILLHEKNLIKF